MLCLLFTDLYDLETFFLTSCLSAWASPPQKIGVGWTGDGRNPMPHPAGTGLAGSAGFPSGLLEKVAK